MRWRDDKTEGSPFGYLGATLLGGTRPMVYRRGVAELLGRPGAQAAVTSARIPDDVLQAMPALRRAPQPRGDQNPPSESRPRPDPVRQPPPHSATAATTSTAAPAHSRPPTPGPPPSPVSTGRPHPVATRAAAVRPSPEPVVDPEHRVLDAEPGGQPSQRGPESVVGIPTVPLVRPRLPAVVARDHTSFAVPNVLMPAPRMPLHLRADPPPEESPLAAVEPDPAAPSPARAHRGLSEGSVNEPHSGRPIPGSTAWPPSVALTPSTGEPQRPSLDRVGPSPASSRDPVGPAHAVAPEPQPRIALMPQHPSTGPAPGRVVPAGSAAEAPPTPPVLLRPTPHRHESSHLPANDARPSESVAAQTKISPSTTTTTDSPPRIRVAEVPMPVLQRLEPAPSGNVVQSEPAAPPPPPPSGVRRAGVSHVAPLPFVRMPGATTASTRFIRRSQRRRLTLRGLR